jgi:DNA-binding NtrC family response regulator/HAMP domain-containing protein
MLHRAKSWIAVLCLLCLTRMVTAQVAAPELAIPWLSPTIDGDLSDWRRVEARIRLRDDSQVIVGKEFWSGRDDASADFQLACDTNHLYLAGQIRDDQIPADQSLASFENQDRIALFLGFASEADGSVMRPSELQLQLMPMNERRPWVWMEGQKGGTRQGGATLAGVRVVGRRLDNNTYQFEAAIPFHQLTGLRPGSASLGFNVVVHDHDDADGGRATVLSWDGRDPVSGAGAPGIGTQGGTTSLGVLHLPPPGPLVSREGGQPLLSSAVLEDLPYLLVPLATVVALIFLLRGWTRIRSRAQWLRPTLVGAGLLLFALGLWLPTLRTDQRAARQRERLDQTLATLQTGLGALERGSLKSYRGPSRDRVLMDLLAGKRIVRQRTTNYRQLAMLVPDQFGPGVQWFLDMPVRPYWLPLPIERAESFTFDPPLRGTQLHLVLGRPFVPSVTFPVREPEVPRLRLELDFGQNDKGQPDKRTQVIDVARTFTDASALGRDYFEICVVPISLDRDLRALSVAAQRGADLRLVGLSLETSSQGQIEPLMLGTPSLGGVLTDLRGGYPRDAGIELAPGATAKVTLPANVEVAQKMWMFYRAEYPGVPTANPGARIAEVVLHFRGDVPKRTIVLEHQVSMFYEMAVHNTRDEPPDGSPAAIALSWIDESKEKHVNLVYPVLDLPAGAEIESLEFHNLAEYRVRFRSVVFGNERAAAPQDPPDSPLMGEGLERWFTPDFLEPIRRDAAVSIYRGGRLSESTLSADQQKDIAALPRAVSGAGVSATETLSPDGCRHVMLFAPLAGDGWDGAVLAVGSRDVEWASARQSNSLFGFLLCLISTPLLLVLLSELLAVATNLRFRLMTVLSVASLVPLGLLSLVLVQVLEGGHATDVQEGMRATVRSAIGQLEDQKDKVRGSARQWLHDLTTLVGSKLERVPEAQFAKVQPAILIELQKLMAGQLPPEWRGGFLRLEWQSLPGAAASEPSVIVAGDVRMANVETPARLDPGVFMQWGIMMIGVRAEETVRGGTFSLTAGRPLESNLLGALAPGQVVLLTDARGYPLAAGAGKPEADVMLGQAMDPAVMASRERALTLGLEERQPIVERGGSVLGGFVFGSEVLRDLQDTPRGLLVVAQPDQRATLELAIGRIPVRAFFLLVAGSLVVLAAFLSFVVSGRISRPIERLEQGAQALSRGVLETRVVVDEGGQMGRLTRTFNQMAADLQGRLQDLQALNRAMRELSAQADETHTLGVLRTFCAAHTAADAVRVILVDGEVDRVLVYTGGEPLALFARGIGALMARIGGAFSSGSRPGGLPFPWCEVLPEVRSTVGLPIVFAGRTRGAVLLGFERPEPLAVDLDLLSTVVAQAAIALERAQLHRLAVQDPVTGVFTPEYFRRRTVDEISLAQQRGRPLAMVAVALGDGDRRPRGLRRFIGILREKLPADAVLCHEGAGRVQAVMPGVQRAQAEMLLERVFAAWTDLVRQLPENEVEESRPSAVVVQFPDDAPSSELLFDCVRERLAAVHTPGASAMESDESLQRAGVTAISPSMREVYSTLRRVAPTDLPILLEGETGVGKEVLTNLVHSWSRRAGGPLVKVHCAALSETLLASELFGHEKGAFTGAERRKIGRFEQADGGTLFLDEVGDIPLDVQVKLLRVLQEREVDRVGGSEPVKVDVRVIAATNRDIGRMVAEGRFREDLYYRLQGLVVLVPPLRDRKPELGGLVEHFRREVVEAGQSQVTSLSTDAMDELYRYDWPGNIRELRNTVFRAMIMARGTVVQHRDVLAALAGTGGFAGASPAAADRSEVTVRPATRDSTAKENQPAMPVSVVLPTGESGIVGDAEPVIVLPSATRIVVTPAPSPDELPERLVALLHLIRERGSLKTEDHMAAAGVSHRTSLRDLQQLVRIGLVERVGARRGAFYRAVARG